MSEFKGTKGKWEKYITKKNDIVVKIGVNKQLTLGHIYDDDCDIPSCCKIEEHANALLISKAPEMLAMLEKASDALTSSDADLRNEIEQLIKEAKEL
jgi:biotin carboxylase